LTHPTLRFTTATATATTRVPHVGRGRLPKVAYEKHLIVSREVKQHDIPTDYKRRIRRVYAQDFCLFGYTDYDMYL
jgi:hypothetical protein